MYNSMVGFWKKTAALLLAGGMLCGSAGCDRSETSSADSGSISSILTVSDNAELSGTQAEFNFDEAVKNITLFGNEFSLPCTVNEMGKNFTLDNKIIIPIDGTNNISLPLDYKGKMIGMVTIKDSYESDPNKDKKKIIFISLGDSENNYITDDAWYNGVIDVNFCGVTFNSSLQDVKKLFGEPSPRSFDIENGYYKSRIAYEKSENDFFHLKFLDNKIVEMTISLEGENYNG